jgi:hypothetical protein
MPTENNESGDAAWEQHFHPRRSDHARSESTRGDLIRAPPDSRRMKAYLVPGAHKQDARVFIHIRALSEHVVTCPRKTTKAVMPLGSNTFTPAAPTMLGLPDSRRMKAYLVPGAHKQDARVFIHIRAYAWSQGGRGPDQITKNRANKIPISLSEHVVTCPRKTTKAVHHRASIVETISLSSGWQTGRFRPSMVGAAGVKVWP